MTPYLRVGLLWLPAVSYMALIWVMSSIAIQLPLAQIPLKDKGIHLLEYAVLSVLTCFALVRTWTHWSKLRVLLAASILAGAWGILDEAHQAFVPGRFSSALDALADVLGAIGGAALYLWIARRKKGDEVRPTR